MDGKFMRRNCFDASKVKIIDATEVPRVSTIRWKYFFATIPEGKAAVMPRECRAGAIGIALNKCKKAGLYGDFDVFTIENIAYIIHHKKTEHPQAPKPDS